MIKLFILFIYILFHFFVIPANTFAVTCEIVKITGTGGSSDIRLESPMSISAKNLEAGATYSIFLDLDDTKKTITIPNTSTHISTVTLPLQIETSPGNWTHIIPGRKNLKLQHTSKPDDNCSTPIIIKPAQMNSCSATVLSATNPSVRIINVQGNNLFANITHEIRFDGVRVSAAKSDSSGVINHSFEVTAGQTVRVSLYPLEGASGGLYECIVPNDLRIDITPAAVPAPTPIPASTTAPCAGSRCVTGGGIPCNDPTRGPGIKTAIGCIHTNPKEFVVDFMTFAIGISGGFAFLMMLLGAFQMITSGGNPDSLNNGKTRLTSAIIGLLFVIFATLLMQIIGVDILFKGLPGFGR